MDLQNQIMQMEKKSVRGHNIDKGLRYIAQEVYANGNLRRQEKYDA